MVGRVSAAIESQVFRDARSPTPAADLPAILGCWVEQEVGMSVEGGCASRRSVEVNVTICVFYLDVFLCF